MKKTLALLSIFLSFAYASFGQTKDTTSLNYSLQQCIDYAYKNQNKMLNASIDEQIAAAKVNEIRGIGLPQINASADVKDYFAIPTSLLPASIFPSRPGSPPLPAGSFVPVQFGTRYNSTAGFDGSQIIFDGSYFVGLQASKTYLELSKKNVERTKIDIVVSVSKAYYGALLNEERFKLLTANVARIKKLLDDTKVMYDNGFVEKIDLSRITVNYNNLLVEKEKTERLLKIGYYLLKYQMGMDLNSKLTLSDKIKDVNQQIPLNAEKIDFTKRVEYSLLQSQQRLYELDLKKNRYGYLPSLVAYGSLLANAQRNTFDLTHTDIQWFQIGLVGAKLTLPIFDGLQKNYRIQQAKLNLLKTKNDVNSLEQGISLEINNTQISYQNSIAALETQKKNIVLAEEVYNTSKIKYDQGVGSNLEIINADASLKEAQTNYYNAMYDVLVNKIDFDRANGLIK
jgi:outer membrane protein